RQHQTFLSFPDTLSCQLPARHKNHSVPVFPVRHRRPTQKTTTGVGEISSGKSTHHLVVYNMTALTKRSRSVRCEPLSNAPLKRPMRFGKKRFFDCSIGCRSSGCEDTQSTCPRCAGQASL